MEMPSCFFPLWKGCVRGGIAGWVLVLLSVPAVEVLAQSLPEVVCLRTDEAPSIDGRGDEAIWQDTEPLHLVDVSDLNGSEHSRATQVRLRWDEEALYVLFTAEDPDVWSTLRERDAPLYNEEVIELFIDPDGDGRNYVEIQVNSVNGIFDVLVPGNAAGVPEWDPQILTAVAVGGTANEPGDTDQHWTVELALPWTALATPLLEVAGNQPLPPRIGDLWRFNFYRYERLRDKGSPTGTIQYSAWSPTGAINFHVPERFGIVVFGRLGEDGQVIRALGADEYTPGTAQLTPTVDLELAPVPVEVPAPFSDQVPDGLAFNLPPGFKAKIFALDELQRPRLMAFSGDDVLHVADMRGARTKDSKQSRIVAFPDRDGDGVADEAIVAADQLSYANSLAFYKGDLYVAETHQVVRLRDLDGDLVYEDREVFIADILDIPGNGFHGTRTICFDETNEKIYLSVGSPCDLCRQNEPVAGLTDETLVQSPEWGTVLEFNADGSGRRVFARGIRNIIGMDLHPLTNALWGTHNHYDLGGASVPPEWIDVIRDGGFYGYPFVYGYQAWVDFSVADYQKILPITGADSLLVQSQGRPAALVGAHLAPMDIHFYTGSLFPAQYRHAAFVALRGGQARGNLAVVPGFKVVAIFSEPDGSKAQVADFLTGFQQDNNVWGKPVGLTTDSQGRLYVSSDVGTTAIFRIEPTIIQGSWQHSLPQSVASGSSLEVEATIRIERSDAAGETPVVTADLSAFGGASALVLAPVGAGEYQLKATLPVERSNGELEVVVWIRQQNEAGLHSVKFSHTITIAPDVDAVIFADAPALGWTLEHSNRVQSETAVREGATAVGLTTTPSRLAGWNLEFKADRPFLRDGYKSLRFAFHPGDVEGGDGSTLQIRVNQRSVGNREPTGRYNLDREFGKLVNLVGAGVGGVAGYEVDLTRRQWQVVEIPLEILQPEGIIELIRFSGNIAGTFYLDDIRLLTSATASTAVAEARQSGAPAAFSLGQNNPNPFNSQTLINFALPIAATAELTVYSLLGQKVITLVQGMRPAGVYTVAWDGRDEEGKGLASGVYLYRLQAGSQVETRKLLLVR